jgi:hypothetical protein
MAILGKLLALHPIKNCHPERSEGSAFCNQLSHYRNSMLPLIFCLDVAFDFVLKGRGFTGCGKNWMLRLLLGGAAVYRCDNWLIFRAGFSR